MAKCDLSYTFTGTAQALFDKLKNAIENNNGTITGDATGGDFSIPSPMGTISGEYAIEGQTLDVAIVHKPLVVSCKMIDDYINNFLSQSFLL